ncbi:cytochrome d ubiquinol oxidase subunit II [Bifidobacterium aquikefiricola]|uniref:Cytochrome d ubiquinol oxidase subunit II n=1 Tax=Bifidobacterium aquikefiricola TaxID=3059038 RepID=A0AB39U4I1_9BIFI
MSVLQILWFCVVALLFAVFLLLEGFDFGVGMATRFMAENDTERQLYLRAIGPHWDGNEVWLITAGGAMFAAFPMWYASLFSGYYIPLFLILVALILRGVSFEFASHALTIRERSLWQWANFVGSLFAPFFLGMMLTSLIQGVPMDAQGNAWLGFFDIVNGLSVVGGIAVVYFSFLHGLHFLSLKMEKDHARHMLNASSKLYWIAYPALVAFVVLALIFTDFYSVHPVTTWLITVIILASTIYGHRSAVKSRGASAFIASGVTLVGIIAFIFNGMFPRVMVSAGGVHDLLVKDASASPLTLEIMTGVLCMLLPIVLGYIIWSYVMQRGRVSTKTLEHSPYVG